MAKLSLSSLLVIVIVVMVSVSECRPYFTNDTPPAATKVQCHNECLAMYDMCKSIIDSMETTFMCLTNKVQCTVRCRRVRV